MLCHLFPQLIAGPIVLHSEFIPTLLERKNRKVDWDRFYDGLDLFALKKPCEVTVVSEYSPRYLYTDTILDDGAYLFNKDVLLKKIPMLLAYSVFDKNTGGHAYDWSEDKEFGTEKAMQAYDGPGEMVSDFDFSGEKETIAEKDDRYRLTRDNWQEAVTSLEQMCQEITQEEIYRYYPGN